MQQLRNLSAGSKAFFATLGRVVTQAWQVSPWLYGSQLVLNVTLGLIPLLSAYLAGAIVSQLALVLTHHAASPTLLYWLVIAVAVTQLASNQLGYLESYFDDLYALRFDGYIWENLLTQYSRLDQTYFDDTEFNNKFNKINQNAFAMRQLSGQSFSLLSSVVQVIATALALMTLQPWLVVVVVVTLVPVVIIEARASLARWRYWDHRGEDFRLQYYLRSTLTDSKKIREIKLYGVTDWLTRMWRENFETARGGQVAIARQAQRQRGVAGILDTLVQIGVQIWLIKLVIGRGTAGLGQFVFYRQVVQNFSSAGAGAVRMLQLIQENALYVNDYFDYMALEPRLVQAEHAKKLPRTAMPKIDFEDVSFRYPKVKKWALRHLTLTIEPGEDIAIIGENGAGKTTFVKLLMRLYDPTEGRILVDGIDLREIDLNDWGKQIGILFQDFNTYGPLTLEQNIQTGKITRPLEPKAIQTAIERAGGQDLMAGLEHGTQQILTNSFNGGTDLSGGQWQRVALARAFYRDAPILILDEPTSAIDAKGEYEIFQQIARSKANKTTIIISHRFSTVRNADRIVVLDHGRISEAGSHETLMHERGTYHRLFELQAAGYR